jgi:hypothetical protein
MVQRKLRQVEIGSICFGRYCSSVGVVAFFIYFNEPWILQQIFFCHLELKLLAMSRRICEALKIVSSASPISLLALPALIKNAKPLLKSCLNHVLKYNFV